MFSTMIASYPFLRNCIFGCQIASSIGWPVSRLVATELSQCWRWGETYDRAVLTGYCGFQIHELPFARGTYEAL